MKEKIALVTGSSRGIGREIALGLADVVSAVAVHYKDNRKTAEAVVKEIREKKKLSASFRADLTKESEAIALIKRVEKKFKKLDILVNNFGPILIKSWEKIAPSEWDFILKGNLASALSCLKAVLPGMRKRKWGRIINLGYSRAEQLVAFPTITPYAIAKTGLLILTRTAAATEASEGITVNMVSPGLIEGGILPGKKNIPQRKLGKFRDVAEAVLFLISEEAHFITGTNLIVAGGWKI
ncbi:MAG: SDR family oxidoreductase [Candidatus Aminicenantes bacterium]|nr:SDR family oxidoreductase [Candidatus Aminicenantes bacterium]